MRKNSIKNVRINSEVQKELSRIIRYEVKDPRIDAMVSVTDVQVAPDLKTCKAYISVLSGGEALEQTIKGLKSAEGYIRSCLAKSVNLRNTPVITFIPDTSIEYGIAMTKKIEEVNRSAAEAEAEEENGTEPDEAGDEEADGTELVSDEETENEAD